VGEGKASAFPGEREAVVAPPAAAAAPPQWEEALAPTDGTRARALTAEGAIPGRNH
jgi:hypothetical protein